MKNSLRSLTEGVIIMAFGIAAFLAWIAAVSVAKMGDGAIIIATIPVLVICALSAKFGERIVQGACSKIIAKPENIVNELIFEMRKELRDYIHCRVQFTSKSRIPLLYESMDVIAEYQSISSNNWNQLGDVSKRIDTNLKQKDVSAVDFTLPLRKVISNDIESALKQGKKMPLRLKLVWHIKVADIFSYKYVSQIIKDEFPLELTY